MEKVKKELIEKLDIIIKSNWISTKRKISDQILGNTVEDLLEKIEDNKSNPDYKGIEIKSKKNNSKSMITLFTKSPNILENKEKANTYLRKMYGIKKGGFLKLNTTVSAMDYNIFNNEHGFKIKVNRYEKKVFLSIKCLKTEKIIEEKIFWNFLDLQKAYENKIKYICFIEGQTKTVNNLNFIKLTSYNFYICPSFDIFLDLLENGTVKVDIRIGVYESGKKIGETHDHGTGFRIQIKEFYKEFKEWI